jgi:hypothetical protein
MLLSLTTYQKFAKSDDALDFEHGSFSWPDGAESRLSTAEDGGTRQPRQSDDDGVVKPEYVKFSAALEELHGA